MKLFLSLMLLGQVVFGLECRVEDNKFQVVLDGQTYEHAIAPGFLNLRKRCTAQVATVYDGSDWTIFDANKKTFDWVKANPDYVDSFVVGEEGLQAFFDGQNFWVYDVKVGKAQSEATGGFLRTFRLAASDKLAALYDGETLFSYSVTQGKFTKENAAYNYANARLVVVGEVFGFYDGNQWTLRFPERETWVVTGVAADYKFAKLLVNVRGGLLYDGDRLRGYCLSQDKFIEQDVENLLFVPVTVQHKSDSFEATLGAETWSLDLNTCAFVKAAR